MFDSDKMLKIRTVEESSVFAVGVGAAVLLGSAIALFYVKNIIAAVLILMLPLTVCVAAYFALKVFKNAVMVNIIDYKAAMINHGVLIKSCSPAVKAQSQICAKF